MATPREPNATIEQGTGDTRAGTHRINHEFGSTMLSLIDSRQTRSAHRILAVSLLFVLACGGQSPDPAPVPDASGPPPDVTGASRGVSQDQAPIYHQMALLAGGRPLPFVGKIAFFATKSPDTTLVLLSISLANQSLTFVREGDRYRAPYEIRLQLNRGSTEVAHVEALEFVRVATFSETSRVDESVIFQRYMRIASGTYDLAVLVKDAGSTRTNSGRAELHVPALGATGISSAVMVYEGDGRASLDTMPTIVAQPRSTVVLGRDSAVRLYVEAYGPGDKVSLNATLRDDRGGVSWNGIVPLSRQGQLFSGVVQIPVTQAGVGIGTITLTRSEPADSSIVPILVTFGDNIPLGSFEDLLSYLRFFATPYRLRLLREADPKERTRMWTEFLRSSDPDPSTPRNEALLAYLGRIQEANSRFRDDGSPGWLSPRGMAYVAFGEPDRTFDQIDNRRVNRVRQQIWEYRTLQFRLLFVDEYGAGRWVFGPGAESRFNIESHKRLAN
jgi:GWxTD domain-containing protein